MSSRHLASGLVLTALGLGIFTALPSDAADAPATRVYFHSKSGTYAGDAQADPASFSERAPAGSTADTVKPTKEASATGTWRPSAATIAGDPRTPSFGAKVTGTIKSMCVDLFATTSQAPAGNLTVGMRLQDVTSGSFTSSATIVVPRTSGIQRVTGVMEFTTPVDATGEIVIFLTSAPTGPAATNPDVTYSYDSKFHPASAMPNTKPCTAPPVPTASGGASAAPSASASAAPSGSAAPSASGSAAPSASASTAPSASTSAAPSASASVAPSGSATAAPSSSASATPAPSPSPAPAKTNPGCGAAPAQPSSSAAASDGRTPTTVSLSTNSTRVTACNAPLLSGTAFDVQGRVVPGAEITIRRKAVGAASYTDLAKVTTDETGRFALLIRPLVTTAYQAAASGGAESAELRIDVHTRVTVTSPRTDSAAGRTVTLRGHLVPAHANAPVVLGYITGGRYVVLARGVTDAYGFFRLTGTSTSAGRKRFTVSTPARATNRDGQNSIFLNIQ